MAATSPIKPADLGAISAGVLACDHLKELLNTRAKVQTFLKWLLTDDSQGLLGDGFKLALVQQLLFDAEKKGWFVETNEISGFLELVRYVTLAKLDPTGATNGDTLIFKDGAWIIKTDPSIYLSPTSGGTSVPDPDAGGFLSVAHGFSAVPHSYGCDLVCNATDAGYNAGDVVDAKCLLQHAGGGERAGAVMVGVTASLVYAVFGKDGDAPREYFLMNKSTFKGWTSTADGVIDPSKWDVKLYARP